MYIYLLKEEFTICVDNCRLNRHNIGVEKGLWSLLMDRKWRVHGERPHEGSTETCKKARNGMHKS